MNDAEALDSLGPRRTTSVLRLVHPTPPLFPQIQYATIKGYTIYYELPGSAGTGKTMLSKAVVTGREDPLGNPGKLHLYQVGIVNTFIRDRNCLPCKWFAESEANARAAAPCVMLVDELDSIAKAAGGSSCDARVWVIECLTKF
ncbi:hypothetical protein BGY98DRAFT_933090 [Russula aff. rugulosa BPL654]|nr:hypothetical protein BGY98DRAFT_933090 [Russula aff. rugulosa BPL654]